MDHGTKAQATTEANVRTSEIPVIDIRHDGLESIETINPAERSGTAQSRRPRSKAFVKLPSTVIELILYQVDANTFASLVVLNRRWRSVSQSAELYAHHLSRSPSFALNHNVITPPFRAKDLHRFRAAFNFEVRRNLYEAYLRPRQRQINIISQSASTSAALPRGEAFRFIFSPNGRTLLALASSRIYVIDLSGKEVIVRREFKTLRRPISAAVLDDGSMLAVLSTTHQVNVYGLNGDGVNHLQVLVMDQPPKTITLAQEGTVLAVAYESSVEVFSLSPNALSTDRRAVRCETMDTLAFSEDGSMIIGSSRNESSANTVVITAPFYSENDPNLTPKELHSRLWTTQILFPNSSSTCHYANLLPAHAEGDTQWLVVYDHVLNTYRAVRTDDTRTGIVYFVGPKSRRSNVILKPNVEPAASFSGDLVATAFDNDRIYIYGVPQKIDIAPDMSHVFEEESRRNPLTSATMNRYSLAVYSPPLSSISSNSMEEDDLVSKVDWRQSLFVKGRRVTQVKGASGVKWVEDPMHTDPADSRKRLVIVAPGGVEALADDLGEESMPVDGGRIFLFDFDYSSHDGDHDEITIEVGEVEPELLPEQHGNLDVEVALERRRSVMHNRHNTHNRASLIRAATAAAPSSNHSGSTFSSPISPTPSSQIRNRPFGHQQGQQEFGPQIPRSTIPQQASVPAGGRGQRQPTSYLANVRSGHVMFHRSNGQRFEIPHESDADNWVPPPPPYNPKADTLLTPELRLSMLGTFSESHRRTESDTTIIPPQRSHTIPEETEFSVTPNITDLTRSASLPRPSYRTRPHSETSLSTVSDVSSFQHRRNTRGSQDSGPTGLISPISQPTGTNDVTGSLFSRRPTVTSTDSSPSLRATLTHPTSPVPLHFSPTLESRPPLPLGPINTSTVRNQPRNQPQSQPPTTHPVPPSTSVPDLSNGPKQITLTGNNLSQRLNYPTPPLPPSSPETPITPRQMSESPRGVGQGQSSSAAGTSQQQGRTRTQGSDQHWPQHRKPVPPPGRHIDPNHLSSTTSLPLLSDHTDAAGTATQDFASRPLSQSQTNRHQSATFPRTRSQSQSNSQPRRQKSRHRRFNPFSSSSNHHNTTYADLASGHGGYGPHGQGPHPGSHPEFTYTKSNRPKIARLDTIQSIPSNAGDAIERIKNRGRDRDGEGRCTVM